MTRAFTLLLLLNAGLPCINAQWEATTPPFASIDPSVGVSNLSIVSEDVVWAVPQGTLNYAAVSTDGGDTWSTSALNNGTSGQQPTWVLGRSASEAWVLVGGADKVLHTTDGGATWVNAMPFAWSGTTSYPNHIHFFDALNGIILGDPLSGNWEIYKTADGGATWTAVTGLPAPTSGETSFPKSTFALGDNVWFGTQFGRVYRSTDRGLTWAVSETGMTIVHSLRFVDEQNGWANRFGTVKRTTDGGATWEDHEYTGTMHYYSYTNVPGTDAWVGTGWNNVYGTSMSLDGGATWTAIDDTRGRQVSFLNNSVGYLAGNEGGALSFFRWVGPPFELTTDLNEVTREIALEFYPNPAADAITIKGAGSNTLVTLYSMSGQMVLQKPVATNGVLDLNPLKPGTYLIQIEGNGRSTRHTLIKE